MRLPTAIATVAFLGWGAGTSARSHKAEDMMDRVQGMRIASRVHCDGATNPQEELVLQTSFSPGGTPRSFHLDVFEDKYCRFADLYFVCAVHGHDRWKHEWSASSQDAAPAGRYWVSACAEWGSQGTPQYLLSGWYQEGGPGRKLPWKQAALKQVSATPEIYEFTEPGGGSARLQIGRK
jgi:hypothetical protein